MDAGPSEPFATLLVLGKDGGVRRAGPVDGFTGDGARVAIDEQGTILLGAEGTGLVSRADPEPEDAGTGFVTTPVVGAQDDGGTSLAVAGGRLFTGARLFFNREDAGVAWVDWDGGTEPLTPLDEPALLLDDVGYAFARSCPDAGSAPCPRELERLVLRAMNAQTGQTGGRCQCSRWTLRARSTRPRWCAGGAVGTLTDVELDGGPLAHVQLFAAGERVAICPLKDRPRIAGAAHVGRFLYVVLEREGTWRLEAFDLGPFSIAETRGWPERHGVSGTRRAVP